MGLPLTPSAALPLEPAGDSAAALHTPRHVPLVSHLLQNSARTNSQNDHLIITFITNVIMRLIFIARQHTYARYRSIQDIAIVTMEGE